MPMFRRKSKDGQFQQKPSETSIQSCPESVLSAHVAPENELLKAMNPISRAIYQNDAKKFYDLVAKKKLNLHAVDRFYLRNAIHWAALQPDASYLKTLLDECAANDANFEQIDRDGHSPIALAVISKHIEHIRLLANKNIDLLVFNDSHQKPLLALAFENDDYNTTAVLLELNANPNTAIKSVPLISYAIESNYIKVVQCLVKFGADVNKEDIKYKTPLVYAVQERSYDIVKTLIDAGADPNIGDEHQETPITLAIALAEEEKAKNGQSGLGMDLRSDDTETQRIALLLKRTAVKMEMKSHGQKQSFVEDETLLAQPDADYMDNDARVEQVESFEDDDHRLIFADEQVEEAVAEEIPEVISVFPPSTMSRDDNVDSDSEIGDLTDKDLAILNRRPSKQDSDSRSRIIEPLKTGSVFSHYDPPLSGVDAAMSSMNTAHLQPHNHSNFPSSQTTATFTKESTSVSSVQPSKHTSFSDDLNSDPKRFQSLWAESERLRQLCIDQETAKQMLQELLTEQKAIVEANSSTIQALQEQLNNELENRKTYDNREANYQSEIQALKQIIVEKEEQSAAKVNEEQNAEAEYKKLHDSLKKEVLILQDKEKALNEEIDHLKADNALLKSEFQTASAKLEATGLESLLSENKILKQNEQIHLEKIAQLQESAVAQASNAEKELEQLRKQYQDYDLMLQEQKLANEQAQSVISQNFDDTEKELTATKQQLAEMENQVTASETMIKELQLSNERYAKEFSLLKETESSLKNELEQISNEHAAAMKAALSKDQQLQDIFQQVNELSAERDSLSAEVEKLKSHEAEVLLEEKSVEQLTAELTKIKSECKTMAHQVQEYKKKAERYSVERDHAKKENEDFIHREDALNADLIESKMALNALSEANSKLTSDLQKFEEENNDLKNSNLSFRQALEEVEKQLLNKMKLVDATGLQIETQKKLIQELDAAKEDSVQKIGALKHQLREFQTKEEKLNSVEKQLQSRVAELESQVQMKSKENASLASEINILKESLVKKDKEVDAQTASDIQIQQLEIQLSEADYKIEELNEALGDLDAQLSKSKAAVKSVEEQLMLSETDIRTLNESLANTKALFDQEHEKSEKLSTQLKRLNENYQAGAEALKREKETRERYEEKYLKVQGDFEMLRKELSIERASLEAQRKELTLLRSDQKTADKDYIAILQQQIDDERAIRQKVTNEHEQINKLMLDMESNLVDAKKLLEKEQESTNSLRHQKTTYESSLIRANQEVAALHAKVDELQRLVKLTSERLENTSSSEQNLRTELSISLEKQASLSNALDARIEQLKKLKNDLERQKKQTDDTEKALHQEILRTKAVQDDLHNVKKEHENSVVDFHKELQTKQVEYEKLAETISRMEANTQKYVAELELARKETHQQASSFESRIATEQKRQSQLESTLKDNDEKFRNLDMKLTQKENAIQNLKEKLASCDQENNILKVKLEQAVGEATKAYQSSEHFGDTISKLEARIMDRERLISEQDRVKEDILAQKEILQAELGKALQSLQEEKLSKKQEHEHHIAAIQCLDTYTKKLWDRIPVILRTDEIDSSFNSAQLKGDLSSLVLTMDNLWKETDSKLLPCLSEHVQMWSELQFAIDTENIVGKGIAKAVSFISQTYEKTTVTKARQLLHHAFRVQHQLTQALTSDIKVYEMSVEQYKLKMAESERRIAELNAKIPPADVVKKLESEISVLSQRLQEAETNQDSLIYELKEVDEEYLDAFDKGSQQRVNTDIALLKQGIKEGRGSSPSVRRSSFEIQRAISDHKRIKKQATILDNSEKTELLQQIQHLKSTISSLETENKNATELWNKSKMKMESDYEKDKTELQLQIKLNNENIKRLEQALHHSQTHSLTAQRQTDRRDLQNLLDKLEHLRHERESLMQMHAENLKSVQTSYEKQIEKLMQDLRELKRLLDHATARNQMLEQESLSFKEEIISLRSLVKRDQSSKLQIGRTLAEMKVLIKKPSTSNF